MFIAGDLAAVSKQIAGHPRLAAQIAAWKQG